MPDDLVERVARAMAFCASDGADPCEEVCGWCLHRARPVVAIVLEEAAKVAENASFQFTQTTPSIVEVVDVRHTIAAAIRALVKEPQP